MTELAHSGPEERNDTSLPSMDTIKSDIINFRQHYGELVNAAVKGMTEFCDMEESLLKRDYGLAGMIQPPEHIGRIRGAAAKLQAAFDSMSKGEPFGLTDPTLSINKMFEAYEWVESMMRTQPLSKFSGINFESEANELRDLMALWKEQDYFSNLMRSLSPS